MLGKFSRNKRQIHLIRNSAYQNPNDSTYPLVLVFLNIFFNS
jgi:hypothetical protein